MALSESEWKLLALKAKNYSTNLYGVKNVRYLMADGGKLAWHKNTLQQLLRAPAQAENTLPPPYSKMEAMRWVAKKAGLKPGSTAHILFEGNVLISFQLADVEEFVLCVFHINTSCDFSLFLTDPDAVLLIHESGPGLSFSKAVRLAGFI